MPGGSSPPAASTSAFWMDPISPSDAFVSSVMMLATSGRSPTTGTRAYVTLAPGCTVVFFACSVSLQAPPLMAEISPSGVVSP